MKRLASPVHVRRTTSFKAVVQMMETRTLLAWSGYAQLVGQDDAASQYSGLTGEGQTIALIDTGIDYNTLGGGFGAGKKVVAGYDFVDNDADPMDTNGHGTNTAGMIAAEEFVYNGTTYQGVAPDAELVALRVGSGSGTIADANIERALQWVIDNHETYGISVVNISLGGGSYNENSTTSQLADEFERLAELDIFVVAASGNDGATSLGVAYPAADPNVFAVGSISASDQVSSFSQRGLELDLLAPGDDVVTVQRGGGYTTVDGTSFSAPYVAGVAALLLQASPNLGARDIASVLRTSSVSEYDGDGDGGDVTNRYYGRLNVVQAIELAQARNDASLDYIWLTKDATVDSVMDASGILHLAYYEPSSDKLMYATRQSNGQWTTPVKVDRGKGDFGQNLSISLDQAGRPAVSYFDATRADLKYAWYNNARWTATTLEAKNSVGQFSSLVFDVSGDPLIAYYKKSGGDLKLTNYNRTTGQWDYSILEKENDVGQHTSLAFSPDSDGTTYSFAIAYADKTNGDLRYTRYTNAFGAPNGGWDTQVIDDLNGVANITLSLDVLKSGVNAGSPAAHIAYQDVGNGDVKYAYKENRWFTSVIASDGNLGRSVQSYVDAGGDYHIVYYDSTRSASYDALINPLSNTLVGSTRIGSIGLLATVSANDNGVAALIGLNRAGKSLDALDLT
jgi:subtilisin family serine protease